MAKQPDNLVLDILREIRADIRGLREESIRHGDELQSICQAMNDWQETTATEVGFAMYANVKLEGKPVSRAMTSRSEQAR